MLAEEAAVARMRERTASELLEISWDPWGWG